MMGQPDTRSDYEFRDADVGTFAFIRRYEFENGGGDAEEFLAVEIVGARTISVGDYNDRIRVFVRDHDNVVYEREAHEIYRDQADGLRKQIADRDYWQRRGLADAQAAANAAARYRERLAKLEAKA